MLVQCIGSTAGGGGELEGEKRTRGTHAGANFDRKRMGREVTRTISGVQERPYWGRASNSKCNARRTDPRF